MKHKITETAIYNDTSIIAEVPILTQSVAAGFNMPFIDEDYEFRSVPVDFIKNCKRPFLFNVSGDSMLPTLKHQDLLIVDTDREVKDNDIIVAKFDNKLLVKRISLKSAFPVLKSDNKLYNDLVATGDIHCSIVGVVDGIYKRL
jgi:SOS-response transcriptional repressor LexA